MNLKSSMKRLWMSLVYASNPWLQRPARGGDQS